MVRHYLILVAGCLLTAFSLSAQTVDKRWSVKSNLLYDATGTLNAGVEYAFADKWSVDISGMYNPFHFGNGKQWQVAFVQPEARYWFGSALSGHFVGVHLQSGTFDAAKIKIPFDVAPELETTANQGWFVGAGVSYGYTWRFSEHWFLEGSLGVGYNRFDYERYCQECNGKISDGVKNYWGLTKGALSIGYCF